ncbi:MAG: hypothetical protein KF708_10155 [Pirellulales bacterium]|nr:hypothetical protein [Pirellulales bacterium]
MSLFDDERFQWRETYFVLFQNEKRPKLEAVVRLLRGLNPRCVIEASQSDEKGRLEQLTILSPDDYAAIDISYIYGEDVIAQVDEIAGELRETRDFDVEKLTKLATADARFDVMHFEQLADAEEEDELLDPSALLAALESLADLTDGVAVDPQSGSIL